MIKSLFKLHKLCAANCIWDAVCLRTRACVRVVCMHAQDPAARATVVDAVKHPWVTAAGLASMKHMDRSIPVPSTPPPLLEEDEDEDGDGGGVVGIGSGKGQGAAGGTASAESARKQQRERSRARWTLHRSVTEEELEAAISYVTDPAGAAAELMEGIFTEVTFPAR